MSVILMDGGMGQELIRRSDRAPTPLWSTQVLMDAPEIVRAVHDDFFAAGAEIATTNTYAIHRDRLEPVGLGDRLAELHITACTLAREARDAHGSGRVAGSLGPLGWSYSHDGAPGAERGAELYAEICAIQAPLVDLFLVETIASVEQAKAALWGTEGQGHPVWLALTVDDDQGTRLRSGEPLTEILPILTDYPPAAVLLNCSTPEAIGQGLPILARAGLPFGAYANGFTRIADSFTAKSSTVDKLTARQDLTPEAYARHAADWIAMGASIIGGCCEVGPAHIAALSAMPAGSD